MRRIALVVFLGIACSSPVDEAGSSLPGQCQTTAPVVAPPKTDILFVIDNSDSMAEEQAGIAQELPAFVQALQQGGGLAQDFQVGVITTSVYQNAIIAGKTYYQTYPAQSGKLQPVPDAAPDGGVILGTGTERVLSGSDPALLDKFRRLVRQGTSGSGQETPFEAVRLAVTPPLATTSLADGGNAGFLRDGARLLVVVVSDEDDCSEIAPPTVSVGTDRSVDYCHEQASQLRPVLDYFNDFASLTDATGAKREVLWTAIAPVSISDKTAAEIVDNGQVKNVDCPNSSGAGFRHRDMAERFEADLDNLTSICEPSYHDTLIQIAEIASQRQSIEVMNVPDPRLLVVSITRKDGTVESCTVANGGIDYLPPSGSQPGQVKFLSSCLRRGDDQKVDVKLLCAG